MNKMGVFQANTSEVNAESMAANQAVSTAASIGPQQDKDSEQTFSQAAKAIIARLVGKKSQRLQPPPPRPVEHHEQPYATHSTAMPKPLLPGFSSPIVNQRRKDSSSPLHTLDAVARTRPQSKRAVEQNGEADNLVATANQTVANLTIKPVSMQDQDPVKQARTGLARDNRHFGLILGVALMAGVMLITLILFLSTDLLSIHPTTHRDTIDERGTHPQPLQEAKHKT